MGSELDASDDGLVGRTVGNYQVISRIGQGGMGAVYLAHHGVLGRRAAVKVLLPEYSNNVELVGRFFNEARATAQLRHRGFVEVFDSGNLPDGSAYLVMEYLRGANLGGCIHYRGSLPIPDCLAILRDVAASVGFAHRHGIVHRDLKPDNIFLAVGADRPEASGLRDEPPAEEQVTVKVLDFGIAKLTTNTGVNDGHQSARTRTGVLLGTPLFMSPEQCRGAGKIDHRSDIYSLGCIAYNMLAEKPPFPLEGFGEIIAAHINEPAPSLRARLPFLPEAVESLVMRMLAKAPADRPQTMDEVVAALEHLQRTLPGVLGGERLLALVPPQAPEIEIRVPSSPSGPRAATTPLPRNAPTQERPSVGMMAKSGGTRLLPSEPGTRRGPESTLGTAAAEIEGPRRRRTELGDRGGGAGRGIAIAVAAVVVVVGVGAGLYVYLGSDVARPEHRRAARDEAPSEPPPRREEAPALPSAAVPAAPPAAAESQPTVVVKIASEPAGATVVETRTGKILGVTPFAAAFPRATGDVTFAIRKHGYRTKELSLRMQEDAELSVTLERKPSAGPKEPGGSDDDDRRKL